MRLLHFHNTFFARSETFIRRFVEKSMEFAEVGLAGNQIGNIPDQITPQISVFEFPEKFYSRRNIHGALRFIREKLSGEVYREKKFIEFLKSFKPDVIHCHFGPNGIELLSLLDKYQIHLPLVVSFYGYDVSSLPKSDVIYLSGLDKLWEKGAAFFGEGPALADKIISLGAPPEKVKINPLLIPIEEYPQKTVFRLADDPVRFLMVGRFVEKKGFHLFLEAVGQLNKELPAFEVNIIGYGEYEEKYKAIISQYHLEGKVNFWGGKEHAEVIKALREHDFFIHPSYTASNGDSEGGAPTILIEAQAVGIPVISSRHADIPYVMGYHDFLADEMDLGSLKEVIIRAINYKDYPYLSEIGRNKVKVQHSSSAVSVYEKNITAFSFEK